MSVFDNLAYPLKARGVARHQIKDRVERTASSLGISELLGRKPRELSGGQMQRVALGRAIVRTPEVFLMDEPLSNLDAKLRVEMRAELKRLQRDLGVTTIYVTHDQAEAMTMADTLIVMRDGRVQQAGSPEELYLRPATLFVAGFIGSPAMNLIDCRYVPERRALAGPSFSLELSAGLSAALNGKQASGLVLGIRPEDLAVHVDAREGEIAARVYMSEPLGRENLLTLELGGMMVKALVSPELHVRLDQPVWLAFDERRMHLFDRQTEESILAREI
jgi:multiple sugar transport system ATP-binding protein